MQHKDVRDFLDNVGKCWELGWSPDRIHISRLEAAALREWPTDTNKNTNRGIGLRFISGGRGLHVTLSCRWKQKYLEIWR